MTNIALKRNILQAQAVGKLSYFKLRFNEDVP